MGALTDYADEFDGNLTPQDFGATPGFSDVDMGGLGEIVRQTAGDLNADYQRARTNVEARRPELRDAQGALAQSYMDGYDENAYDAQAWAQAGIGAATPTLSSLESLNRAVAGYSGVKLKQRADFGQRMQQEKQAKLEAVQQEQLLDQATKKAAPAQLIDLYKAGLISRARLAAAISDRYVNVQGRGLYDKFERKIAVPSFKPVELLQTMQAETSKQLEQDKNLHFETAEEYQAAYNKIMAQKIQQADAISGGLFSSQLKETNIDPLTAAPAAPAPQPQAAPVQQGDAIPNNPALPNVINKGFDAENQAFLADKLPAPASARSPIGAPGTLATDADDGGIGALAGVDAQVDAVNGVAPAPVAAAPAPVQVAEAPIAAPVESDIPATPWASYALKPLPTAKPKPAVGMYNKVQQEREIARAQQEEKNAENEYTALAERSNVSSQWFDTLRQMDSMDMGATGSFAKIREGAGDFLASLGYEKSDMAKDAVQLGSINNLIMQGIQQRLSVQNGVQARDDAAREEQSFARITDPKLKFKALIKQAEAKALRTVEQEEFYRTWKQDKGSYAGAQSAWNKYIQDTPIFTMYGGKPVYMQTFVDGYLKRNQAAFEEDGVPKHLQVEKATQAWRDVAKRAK
jgi:hypothetical protein